MGEVVSTVIGGAIGLLAGLALGCALSSDSLRSIRIEAVERGYATWAVQHDGTAEFTWVEKLPNISDNKEEH